MIISTNKGGLSNRIKSLVSCIRYSKKNNIKYGVCWEVLDSYRTNHHILNCSFSKLFKNKIEKLKTKNDIVYCSDCLKID